MHPPEKLSAITPDMLDALPKDKTYRSEVQRQNIERRRKLGYKLICATLIPGTIIFAGKMDQQTAAPATWGINSAETHDIGANNYRTDGTGTLTITFPGLGIRDSGPTIAEPLRPAFVDNIPNSKLIALEEGAVLHLQGTIDAVRAAIVENNPGHLILDGMSTGGKEELYIMAALREEFPNLKVTLILDSTPYTADTAYELRNNPGLAHLASFLSDGLLYGGPIVNSLADIYLSPDTREKYITPSGLDLDAHAAEWGRIFRDVWNSDGTSTQLRFGQVGLVASDNMKEQLGEIADDNPDLPPITVIYIANSEDHTVDVEKAIAGYRAICNQLDMRFVVARQNGLPHASENDFPEKYNDTITIELDEQAYFDYQYAKWLQDLKNSQKPKRSIGTLQPR